MKIPNFNTIYSRLFSIEKDLAFAEINNDTKTQKNLESEKSLLKQNAEQLLKTVNLSLSDLTPKYLCSKCKDTGYIGTHRCDCYKKTFYITGNFTCSGKSS